MLDSLAAETPALEVQPVTTEESGCSCATINFPQEPERSKQQKRQIRVGFDARRLTWRLDELRFCSGVCFEEAMLRGLHDHRPQIRAACSLHLARMCFFGRLFDLGRYDGDDGKRHADLRKSIRSRLTVLSQHDRCMFVAAASVLALCGINSPVPRICPSRPRLEHAYPWGYHSVSELCSWIAHRSGRSGRVKVKRRRAAIWALGMCDLMLPYDIREKMRAYVARQLIGENDEHVLAIGRIYFRE